MEELSIISVVSHKVDPTSDPTEVHLGKNNEVDKVFVGFYPEGDDGNELIISCLKDLARPPMACTKLFKGTGYKPKARASKIINPDGASCADEILFDNDIENIITELYLDVLADGTFDDDEKMRNC